MVIERVVGQALSAKVDYQFNPQGVHWSISLPLEFVVRWRTAETPTPVDAGQAHRNGATAE